MFQVDSLKRASPSPSRSSQRAYRQPRVITVNRDVATMVEAQCRPAATGAPSGNGSGGGQDQPCTAAEWEAECSSVSGAPFRSRTFSDGFIRNTSQELLLGVDCETCRSLQACPPPAERTTWPAHHPAWHDSTLLHRDFDLVCNCNVKQYNYLDYPGDGADSRPPPHRADIYDIERIKRDTGRTNLTAGTHHSLDRKHAKSKTIGVSGYISKQIVSYDPASNLVQKIKRNLSNLKKIGEEAISKKHQHGVQMSEMPLDPAGSLRKSHLSLAEKSVGRYSQSCIFTSSDFRSKTDPQNGVTYTNFTGNIDQCFDRSKDPGFVSERKTPSKLIKMRSLDNNDGFVGRSSSALGSGSSKFSTLDSRSSRCRSIPRQMSYNEFTTEAMSGGFVCGVSGGGGVGAATVTEEAGGVQTYTHEFAEADLVMLESSPRAAPPAPSYRCTCAHNVDKKIASHFYDMQEEKRATPAPDVTARAPGGGGGGGGGRRAAEQCAVCKGAAPQWSYTGTASSHSSTTTGNSSRFTLAHRKWCCVAALVLVAGTACVAGPLALRAPPGAPLAERLRLAERLLHETPLIDGHNDLPWNIRKFLHNRIKDFKFDEDLRTIPPWATSSWSHTDLPRMKQGRIAAQFWAAYVPCDAQHRDAVQLTFEQIDVIQRLTDKYQPQLTLCTSARDIVAAHANHQVCSLVGVEGGHAIGGSLGVLRTLYQVGVRYLTLTSTCDTPWAECSSATERALDPHAQGGLSPFGRVVIKEMNRLGMLVDLSHVSARTMRDALAVSRAPVLFSHSSARALCNATRNVPDAVLRKLAVNKGLVMVNFYASFLACKPTATVHDAIAHINHIRDVAGVDSVGLGAGFDGINYTPQGLEDVSSYPLLFAELMEAGWSMEELRKLAGLNLLRVLEAAERVARELTSAQVAPYEDSPPRPPDPHNCSSQEV